MVDGGIGVNLTAFGRHLKAENLNELTQQTYRESLRRFIAFLEAYSMRVAVAARLGWTKFALTCFRPPKAQPGGWALSRSTC